MERNIKLAYALCFLKHSWFWLGVWVLYYLLFTNYAGIGLIETAMIIAMTISEVPTGAIADLYGKKKTLMISFFLMAIGSSMIGFAQNLWWLVIGVFIAGIGASFYSGTFEALIYDSLKEKGQEKRYGKIISNMTSISLAAPAFCGLVGGFMYTLSPQLPSLANAFGYGIALVLCFFLVEPHIDTEKFSLRNFIQQTQYGFHQLFKKDLLHQTILLLSIGLVVVICDEMLNSFLGFEYGYKAEEMAILWSVVYLVSAIASQLTTKLANLTPYKNLTIFVGILIAISLIISPFVGMVIGGIIILIRSCLQAIHSNLSSISINSHTESQYRATTLSSFNLLKNIPYVLTAYFIGSLADRFSAMNIAVVLGSVLIVLIAAQLIIYSKKFAVR